MRPLRGITLKLCSVVMFIVMTSMVKATASHVPPGEAVFFRSAFAHARYPPLAGLAGRGRDRAFAWPPPSATSGAASRGPAAWASALRRWAGCRCRR